jgi:hypothetical protein
MITTVEVQIMAKAIVEAAEIFGQKIKEGMIAVQQIKEGYYQDREPRKKPASPKARPSSFSAGQD